MKLMVEFELDKGQLFTIANGDPENPFPLPPATEEEARAWILKSIYSTLRIWTELTEVPRAITN